MKKEKGSILMLVLWVLIILSILSIAISSRSSADIKLARYESENIKALYLAKAGIIKMISGLNKDKNNYDSLNEEWNTQKEFKFGGGIVLYSASDEEARLNLNSANLKKEQLARLGIDNTVSQNILEYKSKKTEKGFEFMEELFLIDGMTRDIYSMIKDYVTIYRGSDSKVNINTAGENVLRAITGDDILVSNILEYRRGDDGIEATEDNGVFKSDTDISMIKGLDPALFTVRSDFFRITAESSFSEDKIIKHIITVTDRNGKIYYWKEE